MGCGKAFPLFKVTKWPWFVAWGVGGFFFLFFWGGGNHVVFRWIVRGIMISRRLQSIWVGTIENWQSIYCQWRGGGESGGGGGHTNITEIYGLSFREYLSTFSTDLFETQKMNFNFYLPGYEQWFKVCVPDRNYGVVFIFIFLDALGPYQHVFLIQFYFCFTQWKIDKICRFIKQSTFCR